MKKIFTLVCAVAMIIAAPLRADESANLLVNGSFEKHGSEQSFFGSTYTEFDGWDKQGFCTNVETADVLDGNTALRLGAGAVSAVYQQVGGLTDANYPEETDFLIVIHYKTVTMPSGGAVSIDSYWEPVTGGDAEAMRSHDAELLQRPISTSTDSEWQRVEIRTRRPANAQSFLLNIKATKNTYVLLDSLSMSAVPYEAPTEPFITVSPDAVEAVATTIGNSVAMETIHIRQGNLSGNTTFELSYTDADQFRLSTTVLRAEESEGELVITYAPTKAGNHTAVLNIDNLSHPSLFRSITLHGTCTDPSARPTITVTPPVLEDFSAVAGEQQSRTIHIKSENCNDYVYLSMSHKQGAAFTVSNTMLVKNSEADVTVTFCPVNAGNYQSQLSVYTADGEPVVVTLKGQASAGTAETVDWQTGFVWDDSHPLAVLNEHFDGAEHNKTLVLEGWQNVVTAGERPWWGYDESTLSYIEGSGKFAKATAYQYATESTGTWEMWLVTPALDYKNAPSQVFAFNVKGENLPEEGIEATLDVVYIDATNPEDVFFQPIDVEIPAGSDDNNTWVPFEIHLEGQSYIADAFHMAFRFRGPNGSDGAVVYYIDDVTWGVQTQDNLSPTLPSKEGAKVLRNGQLYLMYEGKMYDVQGRRIAEW